MMVVLHHHIQLMGGVVADPSIIPNPLSVQPP